MVVIGKSSRILAGVAAVAIAAQTAALADGPAVVASILPVHSLVSGVMDGVGKPALLVKGGGSPHTYALRPSDAAALQNADVVFWIGEELETFLEKPVRALPHGARVVALHEAEGVTLLSFREGGGWDEHGHEDDHDEDHDKTVDQTEHRGEAHQHEHGAGEQDMHIWLDPANAGAMIDAIVATLVDADPGNADRYRANGAALRARLADLDAGLRRDLAGIKDRAYIVFHDAYQYFEKRYGLTPAGSITVSPDRKPSARKLVEIREKIAETGAACVFSEPQFEPAVVGTVIEGTGARTAVLDPLGADLAPGKDAYFELMQNLAASLKGCLQGSS